MDPEFYIFFLIICPFLFFQFIVVSLKDGMFNNANVIFRTAFVEGMSTVIRTVNKNWLHSHLQLHILNLLSAIILVTTIFKL